MLLKLYKFYFIYIIAIFRYYMLILSINLQCKIINQPKGLGYK